MAYSLTVTEKNEIPMFYLPFSVREESLITYSPENIVEHDVYSDAIGDRIAVYIFNYFEDQIIAIEGITDELTEKKGKVWNFTINIDVVNVSEFYIILPRTKLLITYECSIFPEISEENGSLYLYYLFDPPYTGNIYCKTLYSVKDRQKSDLLSLTPTNPVLNNTIDSYNIKEDRGQNNFFYILYILPLLFLSIIFLKLRRSITGYPANNLIDLFDDREKQIIMYLIKHGDGISLKKISDEIDMPISTVSNVISRLAQRNIVVKEKCGKHIKIFINKDKLEL